MSLTWSYILIFFGLEVMVFVLRYSLRVVVVAMGAQVRVMMMS